MLARSILSISLLVFALIHASPAFGADAGLSRWEKDIQAFEAADRTKAPPAGAVLFIGSSSIRLWKTLADDFPGVATINRGFGGSQIADATAFASRIVFPYRPSRIVLYAGDNDLAAGKSPEQVETDFRQFVERVRDGVGPVPIGFIAIKPSPKRWNLAPKVIEANRRIREFAESEQNIEFIDIFTPMLDASGKPRPELFVEDQLHLNTAGYALWRDFVRPFVTSADSSAAQAGN